MLCGAAVLVFGDNSNGKPREDIDSNEWIITRLIDSHITYKSLYIKNSFEGF